MSTFSSVLRTTTAAWVLGGLTVWGCALNSRGELGDGPGQDASVEGTGGAAHDGSAGKPDGSAGQSAGSGGDAGTAGAGGAAGQGGQAGHGGQAGQGGGAGQSGGASGQAGAAGESGAAGSAGGSAGAAGAPVENCLDGVDNDGNDDIDCADGACKGQYVCAGDVPIVAGWSGYYWVRKQAYGEAASACPAGHQAKRYYQTPVESVDCEPCVCSYVGGTCTVPGLQCGATNACDGAVLLSAADGGACAPLALTSNKLHCKLKEESIPLSAGSCGPLGPPALSVPAPFASVIDSCEFVDKGKGCAAGQSCTPAPAAPFHTKPCISKEGENLTCPTGFSLFASVWTQFNDTRACTACSCAAVSQSCSATYVLKETLTCGGSQKVVSSTSCTDVSSVANSNNASIVLPGTSQSSGTCTPGEDGGQPGGSLVPSGPVTICCKP